MTPAGAGDDQLSAVIFDVDGTLVDSERHGHRVAFNRAFEEAGLPYRWDEEEYGELLAITGGQRRLHHYLGEQGVQEDERERLVPELHRRKTEIFKQLVAEGRLELRPGVSRLLGELQDAGCTLAVVTTGSGDWVESLLEQVVPEIRFDVKVFGDDVSERKPDPEAFELALDRLDRDVSSVVAVEDSDNGVQAAVRAGLACTVVVNGYTADQDLDGADLVLDGFGEEGAPARVIADPRGTGCSGVLDVSVLRKLLAAAKADGS
jgi:HAD superfamily hydrolase (TIGR01509 family)